MSKFENYHSYLRERSLMGLIYRNFYLYPLITRHLNGKILDYGCGIGDYLKYNNNSIGVDINQHNVNFCKERGLLASKIEDGVIPFEDNHFDSVLSDNVFEHIENPKNIILEIIRVIRPGGILLIGVPGKLGFQSDADHKIFHDKQSLKALFNDTNFNLKNNFDLPFSSNLLSNHLRQYTSWYLFKNEI
jgi:SAM-dependent methyltransferase